MKKQYEKPMLAVERYSLTQSIASCGGIKIGFTDANCIKKDDDATDAMRDWVDIGGFIGDTCDLDLTGSFEEGRDGSLICYHTSANAAFNS